MTVGVAIGLTQEDVTEIAAATATFSLVDQDGDTTITMESSPGADEDLIEVKAANVTKAQFFGVGPNNFAGEQRFQDYPDTRDDGNTNCALYVDSNGNIQHGVIVAATIEDEDGDTIVRTRPQGGGDNDVIEYVNNGVVTYQQFETLAIAYTEQRFAAFPDTRDDGPTSKALYVDGSGNLQYGPVSGAGAGGEPQPALHANIEAASIPAGTGGVIAPLGSVGTSDPAVLSSASATSINIDEAGWYFLSFEFEAVPPGTNTNQNITATALLDGTTVPGSVVSANCFADTSIPGSTVRGHIVHAGVFQITTPGDLSLRVTRTVVGGNDVNVDIFAFGRLSVVKLEGPKGDKGDTGDPGSGSTINVRQRDGTLIPGVTEIEAGLNLDFTDEGSGVAKIMGEQSYRTLAEITPAAPQGTRSSTFQQALRLTATLPPEAFHTGNYLLDWRILWSLNVGSSDIEIRLQQDDSIDLWNLREEPKDAAGTGVNYTRIETGGTENSGTNQRIAGSGGAIVALTAGQTYTFDIDIRSEDNNAAAVIYRALMLLTRW